MSELSHHKPSSLCLADIYLLCLGHSLYLHCQHKLLLFGVTLHYVREPFPQCKPSIACRPGLTSLAFYLGHEWPPGESHVLVLWRVVSCMIWFSPSHRSQILHVFHCWLFLSLLLAFSFQNEARPSVGSFSHSLEFQFFCEFNSFFLMLPHCTRF